MREAKTGNPGGYEGFSTREGGCGGQRNGLGPSGGAVNDGEDVCEQCEEGRGPTMSR